TPSTYALFLGATPSALAADAFGNVFVAAWGNGLLATGGAVYKIRPGSILPPASTVSGPVFSSFLNGYPTALTLDAAGNLYVASTDNSISKYSFGTGYFTSPNGSVGANIPVHVNDLSLYGAQAGDYVLAQPAVTAIVTPAPLTVTGITANNKIYDGTTTAMLNTSAATLVGVLGGDAVTLNTGGASGVFASKDVGNNILVNISGLTVAGSQAL